MSIGEPSLPRIQQEPGGIRVFVGQQDYLLAIDQKVFEDLLAAGRRLLRLQTQSVGCEGGFSPVEIEEIRQQIITETIRHYLDGV